MPADFSASPAIAGSAKKPSLVREWLAGGGHRQHSRFEKTTSAVRNSSRTRENGTKGSVTFIRFTSPVRIILPVILPYLPRRGQLSAKIIGTIIGRIARRAGESPRPEHCQS